MAFSDAIASKRVQSTKSKETNWGFYFFLVLLVTTFQFTLTFQTTVQGSLRWTHVIYILMAFAVIGDIRKIKWSPPWVFLAVALACNVVAYMRYGFSLQNNYRINLLGFMALFYFVGTAIARRLPYDVMASIFRKYMVFYFVVVAIQTVVWVSQFGMALYDSEQANQHTFLVGGLNSQAQGMAILTPIFLEHGFVPMSLALVALASLYSSRAGVVLWAFLCTVAAALAIRSGKVKIGRFVPLAVFSLGIAALVLVAVSNSSGQLGILDRFTRFGGANDTSTGRVMLWIAGFVMLSKNLFGYGIGNVMPQIAQMWSGMAFYNRDTLSNTENVYLQIALDEGIIGLAVFLWMIYRAYRLYRHNGQFKQLFFIIVTYCISAALGGGTGNDPTFWMPLGLYFTYIEISGSGLHPERLTNSADIVKTKKRPFWSRRKRPSQNV